MHRLYSYVGPHELRQLLEQPAYRVQVQQPSDIRAWITDTEQRLDGYRSVTATFIIAVDGTLWMADRHSEHVVCARGEAVWSAGEMTFEVQTQRIDVVAVTNQSTGYCPEPESWLSVAAALDQISLPHPATWTIAYMFRRCSTCATINIVKDGWFECAVCETPLDHHWNF